MNPVLFLIAVSAFVGVLLGLYVFRLAAVFFSTVILSLLAAAVLQSEGFGSIAGIAIIIACQTVHQLGYVLGAMLVNGDRR